MTSYHIGTDLEESGPYRSDFVGGRARSRTTLLPDIPVQFVRDLYQPCFYNKPFLGFSTDWFFFNIALNLEFHKFLVIAKWAKIWLLLDFDNLILLTSDHSSGKKNLITLPVVTFTLFSNHLTSIQEHHHNWVFFKNSTSMLKFRKLIIIG